MSIWREFTTTCTTGSEMSKLKCLPCGTPVAVLRQLSDKSMAGASRSLEYALLASIALHVAALFGISITHEKSRQGDAVPQPIEARLAEPESESENISIKAIPKKSISKKSVAVPAPAPGTAPAKEIKELVAESKPAPAPAPVAAPIAEAPIADATTVGQYRAQLIGAAKRHKRYPEVARENEWAGNVVVGVAVGADGRPEASVRKSSGRPVLDEQALKMFRQAAREVPLPPALRGKQFSLEVRAIYGLED